MLQELIAKISSKKEQEELKSLLQTVETGNAEAPNLVPWHPDYQSACLAASRSGKPILVFQLSGNLNNGDCEIAGQYARQMLFSAPEIALFIMNNFEPAWQNVRNTSFDVTWQSIPVCWNDKNECISPVDAAPLEQAYSGKIATMICTADGVVLNVLPGVFEPTAYLFELEQLLFLAEVYASESWSGVSRYHREQSLALKSGQPAKVFSKKTIGVFPTDCGEQISEREATDCLIFDFPDSGNSSPHMISSTQFLMPSGDQLREWDELRAVSSMYERYRRIAIHDFLRKNPESSARQTTKWVFSEVFEINL